MAVRTLTCAWCGGPFHHEGKWAPKTCSAHCFTENRKRMYREFYRRKKGIPPVTKCISCGKAFETWGNNKHCSHECRNASKRAADNRAEAKRAALALARAITAPQQRPCRMCGKPFNTTGVAEYCSTCSLIRRRERDRGYYRERHGSPSVKLCDICGAEFEPWCGSKRCSAACNKAAAAAAWKAYKARRQARLSKATTLPEPP
jgi:predicted nucleic acid-binding Zn ribbon protein